MLTVAVRQQENRRAQAAMGAKTGTAALASSPAADGGDGGVQKAKAATPVRAESHLRNDRAGAHKDAPHIGKTGALRKTKPETSQNAAVPARAPDARKPIDKSDAAPAESADGAAKKTGEPPQAPAVTARDPHLPIQTSGGSQRNDGKEQGVAMSEGEAAYGSESNATPCPAEQLTDARPYAYTPN